MGLSLLSVHSCWLHCAHCNNNLPTCSKLANCKTLYWLGRPSIQISPTPSFSRETESMCPHIWAFALIFQRSGVHPDFYQHRLLIASPPLRVLISDPLRTLHNCTYYYFIDYCNISWLEGEIIVIGQLEFLNGKIGLSAWILRWAIFRLLRDAWWAGSKSCVKEWHHRTVWLLYFVRCQKKRKKKKEQKDFQFWISFGKICKMFMFYPLFFFFLEQMF